MANLKAVQDSMSGATTQMSIENDGISMPTRENPIIPEKKFVIFKIKQILGILAIIILELCNFFLLNRHLF